MSTSSDTRHSKELKRGMESNTTNLVPLKYHMVHQIISVLKSLRYLNHVKLILTVSLLISAAKMIKTVSLCMWTGEDFFPEALFIQSKELLRWNGRMDVSRGDRFAFTLTVVLGSNLKALVCPFSR